MRNTEDPFGALLSEVFFCGNVEIDGNDVIERILELDRLGKLTEKQREFWIPPEYRNQTHFSKEGDES